MSLMLRSAIEGNPCELPHIDEDEGHDNIYVKDCARAVAMLHTAEKLKHRIYNAGFGELTTFGQVRDAILKVFPGVRILLGKNLGEVTATKSPLDISACLDISRIKEELGFRPEYDIERGVKGNIAWLARAEYC
jgi:UDP-glucose 4-epimerase